MQKSFARVLQENLTENSFKNKPKPPVPKKITSCEKIFDMSDPFKKELYNYYITLKDLSKIHSFKSFYAKLFKKPIKIAFYWCEEDWQGEIFAIYEYPDNSDNSDEYSGKFISIRGGSCSGCDAFITYNPHEHSQDMLNKVFSQLIIYENIDEINVHGYSPEYTHPELISKFENWILEKKTVKIVEEPETIKVTKIVEETETVRVAEPETVKVVEPVSETEAVKVETVKEIKPFITNMSKSWADIVKKK